MKAESTSSGADEPDANSVTRVAFRLSARLIHRSLAIDLVTTLIEHVKTADSSFRDAMTTAFGEAFNNVVMHGYENRDDGMLDVEAELGAGHMKLTLMDTGVSADLTTVAIPDLDGLPEGGLGVFMMHSLVDEVVYRAGSPNVLWDPLESTCRHASLSIL